MNPLFEDRLVRSLPDSPWYLWLPGSITDGDCRAMPVLSGQAGWFDGSRTEADRQYQFVS
jgi:hypothetical protein